MTTKTSFYHNCAYFKSNHSFSILHIEVNLKFGEGLHFNVQSKNTRHQSQMTQQKKISQSLFAPLKKKSGIWAVIFFSLMSLFPQKAQGQYWQVYGGYLLKTIYGYDAYRAKISLCDIYRRFGLYYGLDFNNNVYPYPYYYENIFQDGYTLNYRRDIAGVNVVLDCKYRWGFYAGTGLIWDGPLVGIFLSPDNSKYRGLRKEMGMWYTNPRLNLGIEVGWSFTQRLSLGIHYRWGDRLVYDSCDGNWWKDPLPREKVYREIVYKEIDLDKDKDGVVDTRDSCPDIPGEVALYGCPDVDKDGIPDYKDSCKFVKGPLFNLGCPEELKPIHDTLKPKLKEIHIFIDSVITPESLKKLEDLTENLKVNKNITIQTAIPKDSMPPDTTILDLLQNKLATSGAPPTDIHYVGTVEKKPDKPHSIEEINEFTSIEDIIDQTWALPIFYDLDRARIRPDAARVLDSFAINVLQKFPDLKLEIGSHTDCRNTYAYNVNLAQRRADSAVNYLIRTWKIEPSRLKAKGYGETEILNGCVCEGENIAHYTDFIDGKTRKMIVLRDDKGFVRKSWYENYKPYEIQVRNGGKKMVLCDDYQHAQNRRTTVRFFMDNQNIGVNLDGDINNTNIGLTSKSKGISSSQVEAQSRQAKREVIIYVNDK